MNPQDFESMAYAKAATNPHLNDLKAALRERMGEGELTALFSRCLDNAYGQGFTEGALIVIQSVSK